MISRGVVFAEPYPYVTSYIGLSHPYKIDGYLLLTCDVKFTDNCRVVRVVDSVAAFVYDSENFHEENI